MLYMVALSAPVGVVKTLMTVRSWPPGAGGNWRGAHHVLSDNQPVCDRTSAAIPIRFFKAASGYLVIPTVAKKVC